ncbi:unnamed protein product [Didymodactylos carnosus]|uniref:Uncharacterized protein n=1 Tax=Didymodactylos carnosus TaxID=1234261 RepID=A0A814I2X1_9BILA|nr:unnamed protein product [Didymodactylos carnosus]CAF3790406.1 unnamed protein product [Didymodactylos carnosus]
MENFYRCLTHKGSRLKLKPNMENELYAVRMYRKACDNYNVIIDQEQEQQLQQLLSIDQLDLNYSKLKVLKYLLIKMSFIMKLSINIRDIVELPDKCIAFREARDDGATFITRQWIADKIRRSTRFVTEICYKEYVTPKTIDNYRHREGLKPFHVIPKPLKTETHISDRLWLCDWLRDWTQEDFLHLAPSDEFYVWTIRRPNYQNDRVWARSIEDIEDDIKIS